MQVKITEVKINELWWQKRNLYYNLNRNKIPQAEMVKVEGSSRWHRVYGADFGNMGALFIMLNGKQMTIDGYEVAEQFTAAWKEYQAANN